MGIRLRRLTQATFLERSIDKHGDAYDYSLANYTGLTKFVTIICKIHGEFEQRAGDHFRFGCNECGKERTKNAKRLDTKTVIQRSREVHGDRYDYSRTKYIDSETRITIGCKIHGFFEQLPGVHYLQGCGCNECGNESIRQKQSETVEEFIEKANRVHGNVFDYSKVNYLGSHVKIEIICSIHGSFFQTPASHKSGRYCRDCSFEKNAQGLRIGTEEFVERAIKIHGTKYDYSRSIYQSKDTPLLISCSVHGEFSQSPANHVRLGQGCPHCGRLKLADSLRLSKEDFLEAALEVHGDEYDYSKIDYIDTKTKIEIVHKKCGKTFSQTPQAHKQGQGCGECSRISAGLNRRLSFEEFVNRSNSLHGGEYEYFEDSHVTTQHKTKILHKTCQTEFWQSPNKHMGGRGCPMCNHGGFNPTNPSAVYYVLTLNNDQGDVVYYKGGITSDMARRMKEHRNHIPKTFNLKLLETIEFDDGYELIEFEKILLRTEAIRAPSRQFPGGTELFLQNPLLHAEITGLLD